MPKVLEAQLKRKAQEKFPGDEERQHRYVYGTLNKVYKRSDGKWVKRKG